MKIEIRKLLQITGVLSLAVPALSGCAEKADDAAGMADDAADCAADAAGEAAVEEAAGDAAEAAPDCARPDEGDPECDSAYETVPE